MKRISTALVLLGAFFNLGFAEFKPHIIYGEDNRHEPYQQQDQGILGIADSTVALIPNDNLQSAGNGLYTVRGEKFGEAFNLCKDEPYYEQPTAANCSGFLVGDDMIATAGHCVSDTECGQYKYVFGFEEKAGGQHPTQIDSNEVYTCKRIVAREMTSSQDYALIQLDRKVTGHTPLKLAGIPAQHGDEILVVGHPAGLPKKIADKAQVRGQSGNYFVANLDTYGGNSGSAVFNSRSLEVVGILVRGDNDFSYDSQNNCTRSNRCDNGACRGEDSTNISFIINALAR